MKTLAFIALLFLSACAGSASNTADQNRNRLATVEASYGAVQSVALAYMKRPICGQTRLLICASPPVMQQIQNADRAANAAINKAHSAIATNAADPSVITLVSAASDAVTAFNNVTPKGDN